MSEETQHFVTVLIDLKASALATEMKFDKQLTDIKNAAQALLDADPRNRWKEWEALETLLAKAGVKP